MNIRRFCSLLFVCLTLTVGKTWAQTGQTENRHPRLELGANVNEFVTRLDKDLLDRSSTTWVRGFLPASEFITGRRNLTNDACIQTFQRCASEGRKVLVTIKWDFRGAGWSVPAPDSPRERECFGFADGLLDEMHGNMSLLALVNEVFVDTAPADLRADADGRIPMVEFLRRLTAHVAARKPQDPQGRPLPLYCGGFTRLDTPGMQTNNAALALMKWCQTDPRITGVNFHLHQNNFEQFEQALDFIRKNIPAKPLIVTEFSLVWNYQAHLEDRMDSSAAGAALLKQYNLEPAATVREFINHCMAQPVSEAEWMSFLNAQSWLDPQFLEHSCDLMERHGVVVATYAFSQHGSGGRARLQPGGTPWVLNPIYIPLVATSAKTNQVAVNRLWFDEYVRRQKLN